MAEIKQIKVGEDVYDIKQKGVTLDVTTEPTVSGDCAIAIGDSAQATKLKAIAIGNAAQAISGNSLAIGRNAVATDD